MGELWAAIIGGVLALVGGFAQSWWQDRKITRALQLALGAEVATIINLTVENNYAGLLAMFSANLRSEGERPPPFTLPIQQSYFTVMEENADKIGNLPKDIMIRILVFYQMARSIIDTLAPSAAAQLVSLAADDEADIYDLMCERMYRLEVIGESLVADLTGTTRAKLLEDAHKVH